MNLSFYQFIFGHKPQLEKCQIFQSSAGLALQSQYVAAE